MYVCYRYRISNAWWELIMRLCRCAHFCNNIASQCVHSVFRCRSMIASQVLVEHVSVLKPCSCDLYQMPLATPILQVHGYLDQQWWLFGATVMAVVSFVPWQLLGSNACVRRGTYVTYLTPVVLERFLKKHNDIVQRGVGCACVHVSVLVLDSESLLCSIH